MSSCTAARARMFVSTVPSELWLQQSIPAEQLHRQNETAHDFSGMTALQQSEWNEAEQLLFLADRQNKAVRVFDLCNGQIDEFDVYQCTSMEVVHDVAYSVHSNTLFVATSAPTDTSDSSLHTHSIRSLHTSSVRSLHTQSAPSGLHSVQPFVPVWRECHRLELDRYPPDLLHATLRALGDESLVFGVSGTAELRVLSVDSSCVMQTRSRIQLPAAQMGFDAKLYGGDTLVAAALWWTPAKRELALFCITEGGAEQLACCPFKEPCEPLFWRDSLLVCERTAVGKGWEVHAFCTKSGRFEPRHVLLNGHDIRNYLAPIWCDVNGELVAWNLECANFDIYTTAAKKVIRKPYMNVRGLLNILKPWADKFLNWLEKYILFVFIMILLAIVAYLYYAYVE